MFAFRSSRADWTIVLLSIFLCVLFLSAGSAGLAAAAPVQAVFDKIGVEQGSRNMIAVIEIIGALGLLIGAARFYAAVLLICLMEVAAVEQLFVAHGDPIPAIVLFLLTGIVAYCTRPAANPGEGGAV